MFPDSNLHVLRLLQPLVDVACGMQDFPTAENAARRIAKVYETLLPKTHPLKGLQVRIEQKVPLYQNEYQFTRPQYNYKKQCGEYSNIHV